MEKKIIETTEITVKLQLVCDEPDMDGNIWYYTVRDNEYMTLSGSYRKSQALKYFNFIKEKYNISQGFDFGQVGILGFTPDLFF